MKIRSLDVWPVDWHYCGLPKFSSEKYSSDTFGFCKFIDTVSP
jgi:hypothetical protein